MQADTDVLFLLVGEGVQEARWRGTAGDRGLRNVRFLPMQSRERYAQLLAASDVCLAPPGRRDEQSDLESETCPVNESNRTGRVG
jgi:hypothetical protein